MATTRHNGNVELREWPTYLYLLMLLVSELYIYPIKSLGGIPVTTAVITSRGFMLDRRWMIVDKNNIAITQRECPEMALLQVQIMENGLQVSSKIEPTNSLHIPFLPGNDEKVSVDIFGQMCDAQLVSATADEWLTKKLSVRCRLVYMPDTSMRKVDEKYAFNNEITSFSDGYPYLLIGQSSVDDLNKKLLEPLPMNRFRPNIVFTGGVPYQEDNMQHFTINNIECLGVKPCARCIITTIDQAAATKAKEPLITLATYRMKNNRILFGQNIIIQGKGTISVGDKIIVDKQI